MIGGKIGSGPMTHDPFPSTAPDTPFSVLIGVIPSAATAPSAQHAKNRHSRARVVMALIGVIITGKILSKRFMGDNKIRRPRG